MPHTNIEERRAYHRAYHQRAMQDPEKRKRHLDKCKAWQKTPKGRAYVKANNDKQSLKDKGDRKLRVKYGISLEQKLDMLARQGGKCAICSTSEPVGSWCVDHNHSTGAVRSILCGRCNKALGFALDSEDTLLKMAAYIRQHNQPGGHYGNPL